MFPAPLPCVLNCFNAIVPPSFFLALPYMSCYVCLCHSAIYAIAIWLLIPVLKTVYMNIILSALDTFIIHC